MRDVKTPSSASAADSAGAAAFGFWDLVAVIVGIVVGTAIFKSPTLVFQNTSSPAQALSLWAIGGGLSLCGAFCYAELATAYPQSGGDYAYLRRAFGSWLGFLFGWAQLTAILTGGVAAMAYAFGDYAVRLLGWSESAAVPLAVTAVVFISALNLLGATIGKSMQGLLSVAKVAGLSAVAIAGLFLAGDAQPRTWSEAHELQGPGVGLAMVFVLYAFGGWNDAAFVAAEVRGRSRNLPWALFAGIAGITLIYLAINVAILCALGFEGARSTYAPAADVVQRWAGPWGAKAVSALVMVSALGAINGMILAGSRIYAALGEDYSLFAWLGAWSTRRRTPVNAILSQAVVALGMIAAVGTAAGRNFVDHIMRSLGAGPLPWERYFGGFETLVTACAPVFWTFFLLTG
ncbi:MAG: amino acid permease, partial [Planctomycetales bacterium]|nr:amino acid permease [Planctomycetales bacterium]